MSSVSSKVEFLERQLQRNERWITLADAKAGTVMVAVPAVLALSGATIADYGRERIESVIDIRSDGAVLWGLTYCAILVAMATLAFLAFYDAVSTIKPRLKYKGEEPEGLIYFDHIARRSLSRWHEEIEGLDDEQLVAEYVRQIHVTARICKEKYSCVNRSILAAAWFAGALFLAYAPTAIT